MRRKHRKGKKKRRQIAREMKGLTHKYRYPMFKKSKDVQRQQREMEIWREGGERESREGE